MGIKSGHNQITTLTDASLLSWISNNKYQWRLRHFIWCAELSRPDYWRRVYVCGSRLIFTQPRGRLLFDLTPNQTGILYEHIIFSREE